MNNIKVTTPDSIRRYTTKAALFSSSLVLPQVLWDLLESMKSHPLSYREFAWRSQIIEHEAEVFFKCLLSNDLLEDVTEVTTYQQQASISSLAVTNETTEGDSDFSSEQVGRGADRDRKADKVVMPSPTQITPAAVYKSDEPVFDKTEEDQSSSSDGENDIVVWDQGPEDDTSELVSFTIG